MPEVLDRAHLGEEAVAADVEAPAVPFDGAADPAHHIVGFQDDDRIPVLHQLVGGGQSGRPGADHHDRVARPCGRLLLVLDSWDH